MSPEATKTMDWGQQLLKRPSAFHCGWNKHQHLPEVNLLNFIQVDKTLPMTKSISMTKPEHSCANVTILHLRPMHQYTHPSAEPKGKAAARNLANVILTASSRGKKTSQNCKRFIWWTSPRNAQFWMSVDSSHACIPDQVCSTSDR